MAYWFWINDEPLPPRPYGRRRADRWWWRLRAAVILLATHAYAGYLGYTWPAVLVWIASNSK